MKEYFTYSEHSNHGVQIGPNWDLWLENNTPADFRFEGSFRVMPARIMGVSYDKYLLWLESYGARLIGKNSLYCGAIFDKPNYEVLNIINQRANEIFSVLNIGELKY